jgi:hypothetical protein
MVKNPKTNAVLEWLHQVLGQMLRTAELNMVNTVTPDDVMSSSTTRLGPFARHITQYLKPHQARQYLDETCSLTYCSLPTGTKLNITRQSLTDRGNKRKKKCCINNDCKVGDKVLIAKDGILCKAESKFNKEPWTIMTVHTNGTIGVP